VQSVCLNVAPYWWVQRQIGHSLDHNRTGRLEERFSRSVQRIM